MRAVFLGLALLALTGAAQGGHGVAIVNQTGAGPCLGANFAAEGHVYRGNFTNISQVFLVNFITTAGFNSSNVIFGDEVRVCGGLYDEPLLVNKTNMTLRGNNTTALDATVNATPNSTDAVTIGAPNVTIAFLRLQNATATGRAGVNATGFQVNLTGNLFESNAAGARLDTAPNSTLQWNSVNNGTAGLHVVSSRNATLLNNTVNNIVGFGIALNSSNDSLLRDSSANFSQNGVVLDGSGNVTVQNVTARNNSQSGFLLLNRSDNNTLRNSNASFNNGSGFLLAPSNHSSVRDNIVSFSGTSGIALVSGLNNTLQGNTVSFSGLHGLLLSATSSNLVNATNRFFNNSVSGIRLEAGAAGNNVSDSLAWNHSGANLNISASNSGAFVNNTFNNSTTGIFIENSNAHSFRGNTLRNHTLAYNASNATNITHEASSLLDTGDTAVRLHSASHVRLANSTIAASLVLDFNLTGGSSAFAVNTSYAAAKANVSDTSSLTRRWFLSVRVLTNESNPVQGALINATNRTGAVTFAANATNATGYIPIQEVAEFVNRSGANDTYIPHDITANKTGYTNNSTVLNVTANTLLVLLLGNDTVAPSVTFNYPNSTNKTYISRWTNPNLEVSVNYTEFSPANATINLTLNNTTVLANTTACFGAQDNNTCVPARLAGGQDQTLRVFFTPMNNSTGGAAEGDVNISVTLFDNSSNNVTVFSNLSVVVDHTGPLVNLTFPTGMVNGSTRANTTAGGTVTFAFLYNETNPVNYTLNVTNWTTSLNVTVNSSPASTGNSARTEIASVTLNSSAADGLYNISVRVCDKAKNCSDFLNGSHWLNDSVAVDNLAPNATNETPNRSNFTGSTRPTIAVLFTDNGTGVNRASMNITVVYQNGSLTAAVPDVACTKFEGGSSGTNCDRLGNAGVAAVTAGFNLSLLQAADHQIKNNTRVFATANATDYSNRTTTFSWNFTVDTGAPVFNDLKPANNSTTGDPTPRISVNLTDIPSGVNRSTVFIRVENNTTVFQATCDSDTANVSCTEGTSCGGGGPCNLSLVYEFNQTLGNGSVVNVTVNASDLAGNFNSTNFSINWTFRVNNDVPYAVNETPNHTNFTNLTRPSIKVIVKDDAGNLGGTCPIESASMKVNGSLVCASGAGSWSSGGCVQNSCSASLTTLNFTPPWDFAAGANVNVEINVTDS
ncbi:MAG: right-handed parallel beta-helix repeat-containing protein, partial [Halobacteria archaeon]